MRLTPYIKKRSFNDCEAGVDIIMKLPSEMQRGAMLTAETPVYVTFKPPIASLDTVYSNAAYNRYHN